MRRLLAISGVLLLLVFLTSQCEKILKSEIKIQTGTILSQSYTTASIEGNIEEFGKGISDYGHCWSTSSNPAYELNTKTTFGEKKTTGSFKSDLSDLSPGTKYYVRAYALNQDNEVIYGDNLEINTLSFSMPALETSAVIAITEYSAVSGGNITDNGGAPITARGVCWNTSPDPEIDNSITIDGSGSGSFNSEISELTCASKYYVRAYATNTVGTSYGNQLSFNTSECSVNLPTVTTYSISDITAITAQGGGDVTNDGGGPVTVKGVCWSTNENPTISDSKTSDGTGMDSFTSSLTGLTCGTTYYVRAYATNASGTGYGDNISFTTSDCPVWLPTLTTTEVTDINYNSALSGGTITDDGGSLITERGVCWSTIQDPTIADTKTNNGTGPGSFTSSVTGISSNTTYYLRAYASNSAGTAYGDEKSFTTVKPDITGQTGTLTDYDYNSYNWIGIGKQAWMAENLKTTRYADGSAIPRIESPSAWEALGIYDIAYCWYDNNPSNDSTYGSLYTWAGAMKGAGSSNANPSGVQGVCPVGWHLPSDAEWKELEMHLGMSQAEADGPGSRGTDEGGKLKEAGITRWVSPNKGATNVSGFTALPGGSRNKDGMFSMVGYNAALWSATERDAFSGAWHRKLYTSTADVARYVGDKESGFSVRCLRDD